MDSGVFPTFSPQHVVSETPKGSPSLIKLEVSCYKPPNSKKSSPKSRSLKLRAAAAADDAKWIESDLDDDPLAKFLEYYNSRVEKTYSLTIPKGFCEETIRLISSRKEEPDWMLEFRLNAYHNFCQMAAAEPKTENSIIDIDEEEAINYFIPPNEKQQQPLKRSNDASITIPRLLEALKKSGLIFCSISEAVKQHPELVKNYLGKAASTNGNFYTALNSAVFSDGSFVYIPKDTKCPRALSRYFRTKVMETTRQFERTLIIADDRSFVGYFEDCRTLCYDKNQLHAAVVELFCNEEAEIEYSTSRKWCPGDKNGLGEIHNFVTKRGLCVGPKSKISWTQVDADSGWGFAVTRKYPDVVLEGDDSVGQSHSD